MSVTIMKKYKGKSNKIIKLQMEFDKEKFRKPSNLSSREIMIMIQIFVLD